MYSTRLLELLLAALSICSIAQAMMLDINILGRALPDLINAVKSTSSGTSATSQASSTPPSTTSSPSPATTSSPSSTPPTTAPPATTSSTTPPTTTSTSETPDTTPTTTPTTTASSSSTLAVSTSTYIVTTIDAAGSPTSYTTEATTTPTASLSSQNASSSTSGMSVQTRNTIIGVVVGVGGFIVLAVIGLVAWRIWGRRKTPEENDGYQYGTAYAPVEKPDTGASAGTGRSPFQSTLESYHAPTQVNTASNF